MKNEIIRYVKWDSFDHVRLIVFNYIYKPMMELKKESLIILRNLSRFFCHVVPILLLVIVFGKRRGDAYDVGTFRFRTNDKFIKRTV